MNITFLQVDCFIKVYCPNNHMCVPNKALSKPLVAWTTPSKTSCIPSHVGHVIKH